MKIFIDPGHNFSGADTGAEGNGLREQDVTFRIADKLKVLLKENGHQVKMSRESLTDNIGKTLSESLYARASMSNEWGAELFVCIHCNASSEHNAEGTETFVYSEKSTAYATAKRVQTSIVERLGTVDRGVKINPELVVLNATDCPAIYIETAFIDNASDAELLLNRSDDFAAAIFEGIAGDAIKEKKQEGQTVMELKGSIFVQEIDPKDFKIEIVDARKKDISRDSYFNCGFFTSEKGGKTIPVGNLASDGKIISSAKENPSWVNLSGHKLTTIYTAERGLNVGSVRCFTVQTDDLSEIPGLKTAISGIPIILGGKQVSLDEIKAEGYFGNELYDTWHGFLGIRHGKLVYVAMKCEFNQMCWALVALGIYDAIKLDGGGSFILKNGKALEETNENRRIHNIGVWM